MTAAGIALAANGQYPVGEWGVAYNDAVDQTSYMQKVLDDVEKLGGGDVIVPAGKNVPVKMRKVTSSNTYWTALYVPNNVRLVGPGKITLLTDPSLPVWTQNGSYNVIANKDRSGNAKNVGVVGGLEINCQGKAWQTLKPAFKFDAISMYRVDNYEIDARVRNTPGDGSSPPNETFGVSSTRCSNGTIRGTAWSDDGGIMSTCFADSYCYKIRYIGTKAWNSGRAFGYASHQGAYITFDHAEGWDNYGSNFNLEWPAGPIIYNECISGGLARLNVNNTGVIGAYIVPQDFGSGTANYHGGFLANVQRQRLPDVSSVRYTACISHGNQNGMTFNTDAPSVDAAGVTHGAPPPITVDENCDVRFNKQYGIFHFNPKAALTAQLRVSQKMINDQTGAPPFNNPAGAFSSGISFTDF